MKRIINIIFALVCISLFLNSCNQKKEETPKAINVIYMIGDGMALPQVFGTMLATGEDLAFQQFPYIGVVDTRSASNDITDSAAGGTALACDKKTKNGMVGMDVDTLAMETILETLANQGKSTGIVVTCYSGHATPADFYAKVPKRSMYEDIAMQMAESDKLNVMIAGGRKHFDSRKDSINLIERMENELGWKVYDTLADIDTTCMKYAVLANRNHMPVYPDRGEFLPEGVKTALKTLEQDEDGFFLMVEGAHIDKNSHSNNGEGMTDALTAFDQAVAAALAYAEADGETLIVITADHETGGITLQDGEYVYTRTSHSGVDVPLLVYGCDNFIENGQAIKNKEVARRVACVMGETNFPRRIHEPAVHGGRDNDSFFSPVC